MWLTVYVYTSESSRNANSSTLEPDWPQHDHLAVSIITQQYSAATFVSLRFHSYMERFGILIYFLTYLHKILCTLSYVKNCTCTMNK